MGASVPANAPGKPRNKGSGVKTPAVEIFSLDQSPLPISNCETPSGDWAAMNHFVEA